MEFIREMLALIQSLDSLSSYHSTCPAQCLPRRFAGILWVGDTYRELVKIRGGFFFLTESSELSLKTEKPRNVTLLIGIA